MPYARRAVLTLYGQSSENIQICPGEANCERWQSAGGKTHRAKERNACHPCSMFSTKTDEAKKSHASCIELVNRAMQIRREFIAGYPRQLHRMGNIEFDTYLLVNQLCEQEELIHRARLEQIMMTGFGVKPN